MDGPSDALPKIKTFPNQQTLDGIPDVSTTELACHDKILKMLERTPCFIVLGTAFFISNEKFPGAVPTRWVVRIHSGRGGFTLYKEIGDPGESLLKVYQKVERKFLDVKTHEGILRDLSIQNAMILQRVPQPESTPTPQPQVPQ